MNHLFAFIRYLNVICVSFPFNMRYSSVLTVTCPEVDRSTTQVEHAQNLPTNKTGQNGYYLTRNAFMRNWQETHVAGHERAENFTVRYVSVSAITLLWGAQWLSGRVVNLRPKGRGFEPHQRHYVVVLEQDKFIEA